MVGVATGLSLGDQAGLKGRELRAADVVRHVKAELNCASLLAREVLAQLHTGVNEPKILCAADRARIPAQDS